MWGRGPALYKHNYKKKLEPVLSSANTRPQLLCYRLHSDSQHSTQHTAAILPSAYSLISAYILQSAVQWRVNQLLIRAESEWMCVFLLSTSAPPFFYTLWTNRKEIKLKFILQIGFAVLLFGMFFLQDRPKAWSHLLHRTSFLCSVFCVCWNSKYDALWGCLRALMEDEKTRQVRCYNFFSDSLIWFKDLEKIKYYQYNFITYSLHITLRL